MSAEVKPGYKMTEVGVIPEDWEVRSLGELAIVRDGTHQTPRYQASGVPFYSVEHVTSGDFFNTKFISEQEHQLLTRSFKIEKGDILMTRIGSIGECKLIDWDVRASFYVSLALLKIRGASAEYIVQYSKSSEFKSEIELHSLQHATPKKINLGPISDIKISLPPTEAEQQAIASLLSEMDALISSLDQLIAKKRDLKQAAMQQLLAGQKRLPGFSGEWEVKRLGDLVTRMANGAVYIRDEKNGVPITRIETISSGVIDWERIGYAKATPELAQYEMQSGDILYSHVNSLDHIGKVALYSGSESLYHGMNLILLRPNSNTNAAFLFMLLGSDMIRQKARVLAKQAVSQASINTAELKSMELRLPGHDEQVAISAILSDMDAELAALEARRDKARQLKQGMMQELLTGRIRLV